jgi:hypothetical protein
MLSAFAAKQALRSMGSKKFGLDLDQAYRLVRFWRRRMGQLMGGENLSRLQANLALSLS